MSTLLCLAADGVASTIFAAALHIGWTPADGIAREESWHVRQGYFELFAARRIGWGGRRAAYLSAVGFAIVLLNFVPVSYFLTKSHDF